MAACPRARRRRRIACRVDDRVDGGALCDTAVVGFNPYRKFKAKPSDYVFVVAGVLVAVALVGWAFFG